MDLMFGGWRQRSGSVGVHAKKVAQSLESGYQRTRERLGDAHRRQKAVYDRKVVGGRFKVGDKVLVYTPHGKRGQCRKLMGMYQGPFKISKVVNDVTYQVKGMGRRRAVTQHFNNLLPAPLDSELRRGMKLAEGGDDFEELNHSGDSSSEGEGVQQHRVGDDEARERVEESEEDTSSGSHNGGDVTESGEEDNSEVGDVEEGDVEEGGVEESDGTEGEEEQVPVVMPRGRSRAGREYRPPPRFRDYVP